MTKTRTAVLAASTAILSGDVSRRAARRFCAALAIVLLVVASACKYETDPVLMASIMAERFVTERLRSPSTAEFGRDGTLYGSVREEPDNVYVVTGYVDAQNAFGAMIRNRYTCRLHDVGDGTWRLLALDLR